jgi:peptidoglycan/xylan/chitin deacetylase (PgdA/CDA1 family)
MPAPCPVLCYHAVTDDPGDPAERLHAVRPATLAAQLDWLAARYTVVPLAELARRDDWAGLAAVTFDDGYRSAIEVGWPICRARGLPASFALIGEALASGSFWRERVRTLIRHGLVDAFLAWAGDDPGVQGLRAARFYKDSKRSDGDPAGLDARLREFLAACGRDPRERNACTADPGALPADPGFAVLNHSAHHWTPAALDPAGQRAELRDGRRALADAGIADGPFYCVPFGGDGDYGAATLAAAAEAGYAGVLLSRGRGGNPATPARNAHCLLEIERIMPADDPDDLARRIG